MIAPIPANGNTIRDIMIPASISENRSNKKIIEEIAPMIPITFRVLNDGLNPAFSCHSGNFFGKNIAAMLKGICRIKTTTATTALKRTDAVSTPKVGLNIGINVNRKIIPTA